MNRRMLIAAAVVAMVLIAAGVGFTQHAPLAAWVNRQLGLRSSLAEMTAEGGKRLVANAKYRELVAGKSPAEATAIGAKTSARGIALLDEKQLDEWVRIRTALSERSMTVCAGLWTGALDPQTIQKALAELPERDMRAWVDLTIDASLRAVEDDGKTPKDVEAALDGIDHIINQLPEADRDRVRAELGQQGLPIDRACAMMKIVHAGVHTLPKELKYRFVRALARG